MPAGEDQQCDRFAAVVEYGLGDVPPGFGEDDELLHELELVALLRQSRVALAPSADESARMRAKVMAAAATMMQPAAQRDELYDTELYDTVPNADTSTVVALPVGADAETQVDLAPVAENESSNLVSSNVVSIGRTRRGRHRFPSESPSRRNRGLLGISAAAAAVMVVAVTGGGAMFSRGALPGDTLYGIKQTTESALIGLTPGQGNKAQRQLDYASTRLDEAQKVNAANTPDDEKSADISQALKGFDDQTKSGSQMWLASANSSSSKDNSQQLSQLSGWAQEQNQRLATMRTSMPSGAQPDADHSMRLLQDVRTRSQSLKNRQGCDHVSSGTDDLGPVPAKGSCTVATPARVPAAKPALPNTVQARTPTEVPSQHSSSASGESRSDSSDQSDSKSDSSGLNNSPLGNLNNGSNGVAPDSDGQPPANTLTPSQDAANHSNTGGLLGGIVHGLSGKQPKSSN
jgi:Domain of unknown function (DUF5667)